MLVRTHDVKLEILFFFTHPFFLPQFFVTLPFPKKFDYPGNFAVFCSIGSVGHFLHRPQASLSAACFSKVFKFHDKLTGEGFAVKVLSRDDFFAKRSGDLIENFVFVTERCSPPGY